MKNSRRSTTRSTAYGPLDMTPNQVEIATSFSRKISLANYGGPLYESEDVFVSYKSILDLDPNSKLSPKEQIESQTESMNKLAQDEVENLLKQRIAQLKK